MCFLCRRYFLGGGGGRGAGGRRARGIGQEVKGLCLTGKYIFDPALPENGRKVLSFDNKKIPCFNPWGAF